MRLVPPTWLPASWTGKLVLVRVYDVEVVFDVLLGLLEQLAASMDENNQYLSRIRGFTEWAVWTP